MTQLMPLPACPLPPHSTPTSLSAAQRCPPELLSIIFRHISDESSGPALAFSLSPAAPLSQKHSAEHCRAIKPLTTVCQAWHCTASEILYENVVVSRPGQLPSLVANSKRMLGFPKHLQVLWDRQPWILPEDPDLAMIPSLLDCSPNIAFVTLAGEQFDLSSSALLDAFHRRSLPSTTPLTPIIGLSCCSLATAYTSQRFGPQGRRTPAVLHALLHALPDLTATRFDEFRSAFTGPHINSLDNTSLVSTSRLNSDLPRLKQLALTKVVLESLNLESLLCPLKDSLEVLLLDRTSLATCEKWKKILEIVGKSLKVLELRDCDFWATWEDLTPDSAPLIDATLSLCPNLTSLTLIGSLDSRSPTLSNPHDHLQRLTIGSRYLQESKVRDALLGRRYENLKHLRVEHGCEWDEGSRWAVRRVCEKEEVGVKWEGPGLYVDWPSRH